MKKALFALSILLVGFTACSKDDDPILIGVGEVKEVYVDASNRTTPSWFYISLKTGAVIGQELASEDGTAKWNERKDWDIAIKRYNVRTNSGTSTTVGALGGVYTFGEATKFASVANIQATANFLSDTSITATGMSGETIENRSEAVTMVMKKDENGDHIMPPVYLMPPVYVFRSADGESYYKVVFTQYLNESAVSGHVKFDCAEIPIQ